MSFGEFGKKKVGPRLEPERPTPSPKADKSRDNPTSFGRPEGPSSSPSRSGRIGSGIPSKPTFSQVAPPLSPAPKRPRGNPKKRLMLSSLAIVFILSLAYFLISKGSDNQEDVLDIPISEAPQVEITTGTAVEGDLVNWDEIAKSVVYVEAGNDPDCPWTGSGTIIGDGSYVLTNAHVAIKEDGQTPCKLAVGIISSVNDMPDTFYWASAVTFDTNLDVAVLRVFDDYGDPVIISEVKPVSLAAVEPRLGEEFTVIGFPFLGGSRVTLTVGNYAGLSDDSPPYYKTDALINAGNSGGGAFNSVGELVGIPSAVNFADDLTETALGLIRPIKYSLSFFEMALKVELKAPSITQEQGSGDSTLESDYSDPRFQTCKDAKANGYGPYYSAIDVEYDWYQDRDSDGVVCE